MADSTNFLARWSRLKQRARTLPTGTQGTPSETAPPSPNTPAPELPPVESLTADSDFSVFMRQGVPEATRIAALRKLWASDPVLANLDGLVEYGEDFNEPFRLGGAVATAYRVLRGMPAADEKSSAEVPVSGTKTEDRPAGTVASEVSPSTDAPAALPMDGQTKID